VGQDACHVVDGERNSVVSSAGTVRGRGIHDVSLRAVVVAAVGHLRPAPPTGPAQDRAAVELEWDLRHLVAALDLGEPWPLTDHLAWARSQDGRAGLPHTAARLDALLAALDELGDRPTASTAKAMVARARVAVPPGSGDLGLSLVDTDADHGALAARWLDRLLAGDRGGALALVDGMLAEGLDLEALYVEVFTPALREVGRLWQTGQLDVASEHVATAITQVAMSHQYPQILGGDRTAGTLLAACAGEELHEVGMRMVADVFELRGWRTHFVGGNVPSDALLHAVREHAPDVVAMSATLGQTVPLVRDLIAAVRGSSDAVVIVGGRAFAGADRWRTVGADGTAADPVAAVELAVRLTGDR
jgi:methanogenic corrinoid protein MtbC1